MTAAAPVASVRWRPWRIPLRGAIATGAGSLSERAGLLVRVETADGAASLGENAPLPGEGIGVDALVARVGETGAAMLGRTPAEAWASLPVGVASGADAGIETALAGLCAKACGASLAQWLAGQADFPPPAPAPIPANALLVSAAPDDLAREARAACASGFRTVKVKVGRERAADSERLRAVRAALGPEASIRIDANGCWNEDEAVAALTTHASHGVSLCEQPLAPGPEAPRRLARVRAVSPIPIAADESCASVRDLRALCEVEAVDAVVLKPLRTGLVGALGLIREAVSRQLPCILTTTFDSGVGTALALHLAALLPEPRPACGLATLPFLDGDIVRGCPAPEAGAFALPAGPGLGVDLDEGALDRFATGPWEGISA